MSAPPLTHHEIVRRAAPLTKAGLRVKLSACNRAERYIEFEASEGQHASISVVYSLTLPTDGKPLFERVLLHTSGLVSVLSAYTDNLTETIGHFEQIPLSRQINISDGYTLARSYLMQLRSNGGDPVTALSLNFAVALLGHIQLRVDASTGGGMPADVWVLSHGTSDSYLRDTLANGRDIPLQHRAAHKLRMDVLGVASSVSAVTGANSGTSQLPDDLLAVLGPQWRPLRWQGKHWKGVLRQLGTQDKRTTRAELYIDDALQHLHDTLNTSPVKYHDRNNGARWQVWIRRLQPLMLLIGILALMPISWFFVSSGAMSIHPLALGLTPLLMVGVVVLTAREIPVMELPPRPSPLPENAWTPPDVNA